MLIAILQAKNDKIRGLFILNIIFLFLLGIYDYTLFMDSDFGTDRKIEYHAVSQKVIMLLTMINMLFQSLGISHFLRRADFRRSGKKNFYI
jgi:hypothetical protein